jgi:lipid II:glycine glycyltransferase (peptidoglycan interpeptide bridge formation enzyme)
VLITERHEKIFRVCEVWFSDYPSDKFSKYSSLIFMDCRNKGPGFECQETATLVIDLCQTQDEIWSKMSSKSCRYEIKRAERDGVKTVLSTDYTAFCEMNNSFRKLKGLKGGADQKYLERYGVLFMAELASKWIAGQVYLRDDNTMRWLLGASRRLENPSPLIGCANRALIWEALKYAKDAGLQEFDFGGYHLGNNPELQNINFFKESFGGEMAIRYICRKDLSPIYHIARRIAEWM